MYYGLVLGEPEDALPEDYADLMLWEDGKSSMRGTFSLPTGYRGKITARVYNTYELYTNSLSEEIDMAALLKERADALEEEAREAREALEQERKRKADKEARRKAEELRAQTAEEREKIGDFSFLLGGRGNNDSDEHSSKTDDGTMIVIVVLFIILTVILMCIFIFTMRKKIVRYLRDRDRD